MRKPGFFCGFELMILSALLALASAAAQAEMTPVNNFVTVLFDQVLTEDGAQPVAFENPRDGWVHIAVDGDGLKEPPAVVLDDQVKPLVWRIHPVSGIPEAMLSLSVGKHTLKAAWSSGCRLEVRAVPELLFCYYPSSSHIPAYGPYTWEYMKRHVLSEVNTLVCAGEATPEEFQQWIGEGRRWISNAHLPGISSKEPPKVAEVHAEWAANNALMKPGYSGLVVDEFIGASQGHYTAWRKAVRMLYTEPAMAGKTFYAWCGTLYEQPHQRKFARELLGQEGRFVWEIYLCEEDTEEAASRWMRDSVAGDFTLWKEAFPGIEKSMVLCPGYLSAPPESLNLDPGVDYHVFMDMQFHLLATDPVFKGLYGIMEYMAAYADEESLQYAHRLFRHYCIEGSTERMNADPYILPHLKNPDFVEGLKHWEAAPAEEGAIQTDSMEKFSWLEGRYPPTAKGDTYCSMKRSSKGPNRVSQSVTKLQPGRLYSVKVISANLGMLDQNKKTALDVQVSNAEILPDKSFQCAYPSCYSHETETYTRDHPAYFSFHRVVFRAQNTEALLTISDWPENKFPEDDNGAVTAFNFVEIQPCHLAVDGNN